METAFVDELFKETFAFAEEMLREFHDWSLLAASLKERRQSLGQGYGRYAAILPQLANHAVGGQPKQSLPVSAAWVLADLASDVFDDLQDQDGKGRVWNRCPPAEAISIGLALVFAAHLALGHLEQTPDGDLSQLHREWASSGLLAARAQAVSTGPMDMHGYLEQLVAKSGTIVATVAWAGAFVSGASRGELEAIRGYGLALGVLIQIRDDYLDLVSAELTGDLQRGSFTLPVLYALTRRNHPAHARLVQLCGQGRTLSQAEAEEVVHLLREMQALGFTFSVAHVYARKAIRALAALPPGRTKHLRDYAEYLVDSLRPPGAREQAGGEPCSEESRACA